MWIGLGKIEIDYYALQVFSKIFKYKKAPEYGAFWLKKTINE